MGPCFFVFFFCINTLWLIIRSSIKRQKCTWLTTNTLACFIFILKWHDVCAVSLFNLIIFNEIYDYVGVPPKLLCSSLTYNVVFVEKFNKLLFTFLKYHLPNFNPIVKQTVQPVMLSCKTRFLATKTPNRNTEARRYTAESVNIVYGGTA